jgi:hypothetical protein
MAPLAYNYKEKNIIESERQEKYSLTEVMIISIFICPFND